MMQGSVHAFEFLNASSDDLPALVVLVGEESLLRRLVIQRILEFAGTDAAEGLVRRVGNEATWNDVRDDLASRSLFHSTSNLVHVLEADGLVSASRAQLEDYAASESSSSTLILELSTFPANTRLAKIADGQGLVISCRPPETKIGKRTEIDVHSMVKWLVPYAKSRYGLHMSARQMERVVELVGDQMGLIDSEVSKLALFADPHGKVTDTQVDDVVGGWRTQTTWELLDAACAGNAASAIQQLDRLIQSGEPQQAIFGAISWSLRRFAAAVRVVHAQERSGSRPDLAAALASVEVPTFPKDRFQRVVSQLRQIGRKRAGRLYRQLLSADLKMKGSHAAPDRARFVLEQLIFSLSDAAREPV